MTDPYKVLGVSQNADMDDIKKQYRSLCRKYHPDANINNPDRDKAEEKFKEIQDAYHRIVKEREQGISGGYGEAGAGSGNAYDDPFGFGSFGFGGFGAYGNRNTGSYGNGTDYISAAANYVAAGRYREALNTLSNVEPEDRTADWYYYSSAANMGMGNNIAALEHARTAVRMNPSDPKYTRLLDALESGGRWYAGRRADYGDFSNMSRICLYCLALQCCTGGSGILCCI